MGRRLAVVAMALAMLAGTGVAGAGPVNQSESGYSGQNACLYWFDYEGVEQGWIRLCGGTYESDYGSYRYVDAERRVQTCDANGDQCSDAYSERYSGPADPSEFSTDIVAGTASFNIVLAGEDPNDECTVQATALAEGTYGYVDPYPTVHVYANPLYPSVWVKSGNTEYTAQPFPTGAAAFITQRNTENTTRDASGSGSVCEWVDAQTADHGQMWSYTNSSTYYSITPTQLP